MRTACLLVLLCVVAPAGAQTGSALQQDLPRERSAVEKNCGRFDLGALPACAITLTTESPLHLSVGTIAPQNEVAFGPAIAGRAAVGAPWYINWSADAVVAPAGAWRTGAYVNFVRTNRNTTAVRSAEPAASAGTSPETDAVYSTYWQTISLHTLSFFGLGSAPSEVAHTLWTMRQTIVGGSALVPVIHARGLGLSVSGAVNGRWFHVGGRSDGEIPSIDEVFQPRDVPGLGDERRFVQFSEGVRLSPSMGARVRASYRFALDQFVADEDASFTRWTIDLGHEFPFSGSGRPRSRDANTPNHCSPSADDRSCATAATERYGAVSLHILSIGSDARGSVPFYLQPTIGGADINGDYRLTSFRDYWFRAPNVLALQLAVTHTLANLRLPRDLTVPISGFIMAEQGKAAGSWSDLFHRFVHSYATGLTIRAGGFPEVVALFAWGHEGHRWSATISPSLLGGGRRPSIY